MKWYLDFGHGGSDPGAMGKLGTKESECVLKVGMIVKSNLEKANEIVVTTRQSNTYYSLPHRTTKANSNNCDYFVSLHFNASTSTTAKGCEVWVYDKDSKLYNLSNNLCKNLSSNLHTPSRGVKVSKGFYVLKHTKMPALLIEVDFISHVDVEKALASPSYITNIANTISSTLLEFVGKSMISDDEDDNSNNSNSSSNDENTDNSNDKDDNSNNSNDSSNDKDDSSNSNSNDNNNASNNEDTDNSKLYRVCIGAFKNKSNAVILKNNAISKGFVDTYIQ